MSNPPLKQGDRIKLTSLILTLFLIILQPCGVFAQQTLADADWFERELGDGVVWRYYLFDNLYGARQSVSYIDVDLSNPNVSVEFPYLANSRQKISSMIPSQFPDALAGINGTYFDTSVGGHLTYLRINSIVIPPGGALFSPWGYEGALALDASENASIQQIPSGGWVNDTTHPDILACGPLVIVGGVIPSAYLTSIGSHCTSRHPRSAVGITSNYHLILLTVDGRTEMADGMTCEELGQAMQELGCPNALNLDGGGSTTLWGEGELYNGVLNYPSDNGMYDHAGERACSNAIAIESAAPSPKTWDARLMSKTYSPIMDSGSKQTVTLVYDNIGTATWTIAETKLVLARPDARTSELYDAATWHSSSQPALLSPASVAQGETGSFSFTLKAPAVSKTTVYNEHFMMTQTGIGRIGPADSEAWMQIVVQPPVPPGETFIVESRIGGQNFGWYSDSGMANTSYNCTAPDCTGNIGTRYGSTYRSVAGSKNATATPDFPEGGGYYKVYVAWCAGGNRRNPITYHVHHSKGTETFQIDQTATADVWTQLGSDAYYFNEGFGGGSVVMTNEDIDVSGSMYAGAVKFEYVVPDPPDKTYVVHYLSPASSKPSINGQADGGEWAAASPAGSGYVFHNNPAVSAAEDGSFKMLFDDTCLYILFQMNNAYLAGYATPPVPFGYSDLGGDKINFFFTPKGIYTQPFYRILFCPNPTDGNCYAWSQASVVKTTDPLVGTDWVAGGETAYAYTAGQLTIERRIPWINFNYAGIDAATCPEDGDVWGVQPCVSNEVSAGNWEWVNWEPDNTASYVYGEPFGALEFEKTTSSVNSWGIY
ncbi:phosphodiester glycosidase family protein [Candidatus Sumerlaeota bacterium]|nr:phosphodiester glycosidase family protein [Candidatus Sumerlaeota bacterium]